MGCGQCRAMWRLGSQSLCIDLTSREMSLLNFQSALKKTDPACDIDCFAPVSASNPDP